MTNIELLDSFPEVASETTERTVRVQTQIVKGHVNKLMLVYPQGSSLVSGIKKQKLSVKHIGDRITNQITELPFKVLFDISNEKYGSVIGQPQDFALLKANYLTAGGTDTALGTALANSYINEKVAVMVDLGSFELVGGEESHIVLERFGKANEVIPEVHIFAISDDDTESYNLIQYDVDQDLNEKHQNAREIYFADSKSHQTSRNLSIYVDSPSNQYHTNSHGAVGYSMLTGKFEQENPDVTKIYENIVPEDVVVKFVGATVGEIDVIVLRVLTDFTKYENQTRNALLKQSKIVENLEKTDPSVASVMQASNVIPTSVQLSNKADEFKN